MFFLSCDWHSIYSVIFHVQFLISWFVCLVTGYALRNPQLPIFSLPSLPLCRRRIDWPQTETRQTDCSTQASDCMSAPSHLQSSHVNTHTHKLGATADVEDCRWAEVSVSVKVSLLARLLSHGGWCLFWYLITRQRACCFSFECFFFLHLHLSGPNDSGCFSLHFLNVSREAQWSTA